MMLARHERGIGIRALLARYGRSRSVRPLIQTAVSYSFLAPTIVFLSLLISAASGIVTAGDREASAFNITLRDADDTAKVTTEDERVIVSIRSSRGIGRATIERRGASWPERVVMRLHVSGLERFQVTNGTVTLHASVSSHAATPRVRRWKNDQENVLLDKESRYWMPVKLLDSKGQQTREVPIKEGYFEILLPTAFFAGNPPEVTLQWIDFYRG